MVKQVPKFEFYHRPRARKGANVKFKMIKRKKLIVVKRDPALLEGRNERGFQMSEKSEGPERGTKRDGAAARRTKKSRHRRPNPAMPESWGPPHPPKQGGG